MIASDTLLSFGRNCDSGGPGVSGVNERIKNCLAVLGTIDTATSATLCIKGVKGEGRQRSCQRHVHCILSGIFLSAGLVQVVVIILRQMTQNRFFTLA
jgi:hypothetical protein